jgi:hypothetical protein
LRLPGAPSANLIANGSFELEYEGKGFASLDPGSNAIPVWTVTRGQIDCLGLHWGAADGKQSLDLHANAGFGGIQQSFLTTKGHRYGVTFGLGEHRRANAATAAIRVSVLAPWA